MKENLDKEVLKLEMANCGVEQRLKLLGMYMTVLGEKSPQLWELISQKSENSSCISKLQGQLHHVEDSIMSVEADFVKTAVAPWCLDAAGPKSPELYAIRFVLKLTILLP
jgi:hypothetical protein